MTVGPGGTGPGYMRPQYMGPGYALANQGRAQMLASHQDRDRAVEFLKQAFAEGRMGKDEYDIRMGQALAARTYADLDALMTDLPGAQPPPGAMMPPRTNGFAVASLICGIAQVFFWTLTSIPAVIFGHMARRQIRQTGEQGDGMAVAGLVLGWIGIGLTLLAVLGFVLLFAAVSHTAGVAPGP
jgi:hypothetical protein